MAPFKILHGREMNNETFIKIPFLFMHRVVFISGVVRDSAPQILNIKKVNILYEFKAHLLVQMSWLRLTSKIL